ncbi:MAG: DUF2516 family protein [Nostocoides sp.]
MDVVMRAQGLILLVLGIALLGTEVFAFVDAVRHRPDAYVAAGKRTKPLWSVVTGVGVVLGFLTLFNPLNLFALLGIVAAGVYLADVRPALRQVMGRGGDGRHMGPYGPW